MTNDWEENPSDLPLDHPDFFSTASTEEPISSSVEEPAPLTPNEPTGALQEFAEKLEATQQPISASFPFSLLITGPLTAHEKEKLLDLLSRHNMGIREVDLEPQFIGERILIPRISEYAGVLLVQALRGTRARLRLGPSDSIFSTEETREETPLIDPDLNIGELRIQHSETAPPAEQIRISADSSIPDIPSPQLIDSIFASATLEADTVEAQSSPEYEEVLDALIRELKYKAHRKGAIAITHFTLDLVPLSLPSQYRLTVKGSAIKQGEPQSSLNSVDFV